MKKLVFIIALLGVFSFATPKVADADVVEPCETVIIVCPDGLMYMCICCDPEDRLVWPELLCYGGDEK